jgi:hypothetical protein
MSFAIKGLVHAGIPYNGKKELSALRMILQMRTEIDGELLKPMFRQSRASCDLERVIVSSDAAVECGEAGINRSLQKL